MSSKKEARAYKAGKGMGLALVETIQLMYQNNTAKNYISGLMDTLSVEYKKRTSVKIKEKVI